MLPQAQGWKLSSAGHTDGSLLVNSKVGGGVARVPEGFE
jgi:hypothetical protein